MVINVHAGHNPDGMVACGAVGLIKESTHNRLVVESLIAKLRAMGHTVYDCTVNDGTSSGDVLTKIVRKSNANAVDLDISIHFNAGARDNNGNGNTTGVECLVYSTNSNSNPYASKICEHVSGLGFRNRGVKVRTDLYVLKNTVAPCVLVECCFVDDLDDVNLYNTDKMAEAIARGITGEVHIPNSKPKEVKYGVKVHTFNTKEVAEEFGRILKEQFNAYNEVYEIEV